MTWYDSSWTRRKKITLTGGTSGAQTDFQIKLTVTYDSDMQTDFDDLRFTQSDGITLIDFWMESYTASTSAVVWVEFPTTPANTITQDYYMYYSNSLASSAGDIKNTMLFGDDFPGTTLDSQWGETSGSPTISGGELSLDSTEKVRAQGYSIGQCRCRFRSKKSNTTSGLPRLGMSNMAVTSLFSSDDCMGVYPYNSGNMNIITSNEGTSTYSIIDTYSADTYYIYEMRREANTSVMFYIDDVYKATNTTNVPNENLNPRIDVRTSGCTITADWYFVSKYVVNPATYVFGSEELEIPYGLLRRINGGYIQC